MKTKTKTKLKLKLNMKTCAARQVRVHKILGETKA